MGPRHWNSRGQAGQDRPLVKCGDQPPHPRAALLFPVFYCTTLDLPPENWKPQDVVACPGVRGEAQLAVQGTLRAQQLHMYILAQEAVL